MHHVAKAPTEVIVVGCPTGQENRFVSHSLGHAWTLACFYDFSDKMSFGAESLSIKTDRFGWTYYGLDPTRTEKQLQLSLRLRFGN